jgi:hypothetical protein
MELSIQTKGNAMNAIAEPEARAANIEVKCVHLASVQGPNDTRHHVLFDPTSDTVAAIREWEDSGLARGITVEDRAGLFSRDRAMRVVNTVFSYGTLVVTTEDAEE